MSHAVAASSPSHANLARAFVSACAARGDRDFMVDAEVRLSGRAAAEHSARIASALAHAGLSTGGRVAFLARPSASHAVTWFAAVRLGAIVTSLHLLETPARLTETLAWLDCTLLIYDDEFEELAQSVGGDLRAAGRLSLAALWADAQAATAMALDRGGAGDPVAIVLSSGSTGLPKGVIHTNATTLASVMAGPHLYRAVDGDSSVLVCIGTSFGGWCNTVLPFACLGAKLVFHRRFEAGKFLEGLTTERITVAPLVPTMWRMVLAAGPENYDLSALRLAFMSGEMPSRNDVANIHDRITPNVRSAYLSTEGACGCGFVMDEDVLLGENIAVAAPVPGVDIRLASPDTSELPSEILLRGPSLAVGYWKDPKRTAERFENGWWRSGDTGVLTEHGRLRVVGRTDHLINSGGIKIQAEELEAALLEHPLIRQAAVVGKPDSKWGQRAEAYVVTTNEACTDEILMAWCKQGDQVSLSKFLKRIHIVERLPTGPTGKLFRTALL